MGSDRFDSLAKTNFSLARYSNVHQHIKLIIIIIIIIMMMMMMMMMMMIIIITNYVFKEVAIISRSGFLERPV